MFDVTMRLIGIFIRLAPLAIACFMFNLAAVFGWELLVRLGAYVGVVLLALGLHMFVTYPIALRPVRRRSRRSRFFREVQEAMVMAFSTASSNATLPTALRVAEEKLKLPRRVSRFVLTIGATANQNGTAIFEGITVLFLAQFFGIQLDLWAQVTVLLICILAGIGTAGVPAGSLPVDRADPRIGRRAARGDRADPRRRPLARHVPDHAQRHRRPRHRDARLAAARKRRPRRPRQATPPRLRRIPSSGRLQLALDDLVGERAVQLGEMVELRLVGGEALAQRAQLGVEALHLRLGDQRLDRVPARPARRACPCRASGRAGWRSPR